jgi:hypothetical protein
MSVNYLDSHRKVAYLSKSGVVVTASNYAAPENDISTYEYTAKNPELTPYSLYSQLGLEVAPWGANNLKPNYLLMLLAQSGINSQLIYTKVSFALGPHLRLPLGL